MVLNLTNTTGGVTSSSAKCFEWVSEVCTGFTPYEVHWLNRYGGFDSWTFTSKSKINTELTQATFKNDADEILSSTIVKNTYKRFVQPFHTQQKETYSLNSQNLYGWEYEGMEDLKKSPEVYLKLNGNFYSVTVKGNSTIRNHRAEEGDIFNMSINLTLDNSEQRQW
jgi:hypothetical protein